MHRTYKHKKSNRLKMTGVLLFGFVVFGITAAAMPLPKAYARPAPQSVNGVSPAANNSGSGASGSTFTAGGNSKTKFQCGSGANTVYTSIDIGCKGSNCKSNKPGGCSALTDAVFAIIRAISVGVGLVIVASMVWAGIQYTASRDDPSAVGKAKERIRSNVIALLVYIFAYAILNYVIPNGFFG